MDAKMREKEAKEDLDKFKEYLHMYEEGVKRYKELEHKLIDEKKKYEHLYQEKEEIKSGAKELLERVKKETVDKENLVDRRIINNLLVNFVNLKNIPETRRQMLESMASILNFSISEKEILGLIKKTEKVDVSKEEAKISDKLINFLMDDE